MSYIVSAFGYVNALHCNVGAPEQYHYINNNNYIISVIMNMSLGGCDEGQEHR